MDVVLIQPGELTRIRVSSGFKNSLQRIRMIVQPFIMALPVIIIWHYLFVRGLHSTREADEPIVNFVGPTVAVVHMFLVNLAFGGERENVKEMKRAVREKNKEGSKELFLQHAEEQTPSPLLYVLFVTGTYVQAWTASLNFTNYWTGFFAVLSIAYLVALLWEMVADYDNPFSGMWVIKGVPREWMKEAKIKVRLSDRIFNWIFNDDERCEVPEKAV